MTNFGGISLGIKSERIFDDIEFKFKKIEFKKQFFGVILLKSNETFYSCFVSLAHQFKDKYYLERLINLDYFNLIVFNHSEENKIYRILNDSKNKVLFYLPNPIYDNLENNVVSNELHSNFPARMLWNN